MQIYTASGGMRCVVERSGGMCERTRRDEARRGETEQYPDRWYQVRMQDAENLVVTVVNGCVRSGGGRRVAGDSEERLYV